MTGSFADEVEAAVQTLMYRQSSLVGGGSGAPAPRRPPAPPPPCMQRGPKAVAIFTPSHFGAGCGAFHLRGPTGGAAYGMPLNTRTSALVPAAPETSPLSVFTGSVTAADATLAAQRIAAESTRRFIRILPAL